MDELSNVVAAFSAEQVQRLSGLTKRRLTYWDKTGFFAPSYADDNRRSPYTRIYSFRDVVGLRPIWRLTEEFHVSLQHLRKVAEKLSHLANDLWSTQVLYDEEAYPRHRRHLGSGISLLIGECSGHIAIGQIGIFLDDLFYRIAGVRKIADGADRDARARDNRRIMVDEPRARYLTDLVRTALAKLIDRLPHIRDHRPQSKSVNVLPAQHLAQSPGAGLVEDHFLVQDDHCVPDSVGRVLCEAGYDVILLRERIAPDSPDPLVAAVSESTNGQSCKQVPTNA